MTENFPSTVPDNTLGSWKSKFPSTNCSNLVQPHGDQDTGADFHEPSKFAVARRHPSFPIRIRHRQAIVQPRNPLAQAGRSRRRHVRAAERGAVTGVVRWRCPTTTPASSASASSASGLARPRREGSRRPATPGRRRGRPDGTQDRKSPSCQRRLLRLPRPRLDIPDRPRVGLKVPGSSFHRTTRAPSPDISPAR
jgi:hypothetical protein